MKTFLTTATLVCLLSTGSMAEVFSPAEQIKLDMCPKLKTPEASEQCFKRSTFDIIALSVIVEKSAKDNEAKAYANTKIGMIYEVDVGDKATALSYYKKACSLGGQKGCLLAKGLEAQ